VRAAACIVAELSLLLLLLLADFVAILGCELATQKGKLSLLLESNACLLNTIERSFRVQQQTERQTDCNFSRSSIFSNALIAIRHHHHHSV
jgi:hypothetical protein